VSIAAPHKGSKLAFWVLKNGQKQTLMYWLARLIGQYDFKNLRFVPELTPDHIHQADSFLQMVPKVQYGSIRCNCETACFLPMQIISKGFAEIKDGDGFVELDSQLFGTDLGIFDLDHISAVGADDIKREERLRLFDTIWKYIN
jgi:hypothetical protein